MAVLPASAQASSCADNVVADWHDDGRIDGTYAPDCYRDAVSSLPEDVLVYSSAQTDINRALQRRVAKSAQTSPKSESSGSSPFKLPLLIVATLAAVMLVAGFAADVARR